MAGSMGATHVHKIPITQTVIIDGVEVYSQGSGHDSLNQCVPFAASTVNDEESNKS